MEIVPDLLGAIFAVFLIAKGAGLLASRLGLPSMVGELIGGIVVANVAFGAFTLSGAIALTPSNTNVVAALAEIGVAFLLFQIGLQVRPRDLRLLAGPAARLALLGLVVPFAFGFLFVLLWSGAMSWTEGLFAGVAVASTSLGIAAHLLSDHGLLEDRRGRLFIAVLVVEEIGALALLAVLLDLVKGRSTTDLGLQAGLVLAMAVGLVLLTLYLVEPALRRFLARTPPAPKSASSLERNGPFLLALLVCLGFGALAESLEVAGILGAFLAGLAWSELAPRYGVDRAFESLNAFLVPFFFFYVGYAVSFGNLLAVWPLAVALSVGAIAVKMLVGRLEAHQVGREDALLLGSLLVARGETGVIIASAAIVVGAITPDYYTAIVTMAIASSVVGPALFGHLVRRRAAPAPGESPGEGSHGERAPQG